MIVSNNRAALGLLMVAAVILLYGLGDAPLEPFDDATYADVAKNIVTRGDWLHFTWLGGLPFLNKPPLYYWITAALFKLLGIGEYSARFFPAVCGIGLLAVVYFLARRFSERHALVAPLLLLTVADFWEFSGRAMLDIPVTFFVTLALGLFWMAQQQSSRGLYLLYGVAIAIGVLTKSAVGLIPVAVSGLFFLLTHPQRLLDRSYLAGNALAAAILLPWHLYMVVSSGKLFLQEYIGYQMFALLTGEMTLHNRPIWYFAVYLFNREPLLLALGLLAIIIAIDRVVETRDEASLFLLIWSGFIFALFSLSRGKLRWYLLPLYPPLAILVASILDRIQRGRIAMPVILALILVPAAALEGYRFQKHRIERLSPLDPVHQVATIAKELKTATQPKETISIFGAGEPIPMVNFYADRPTRLLVDDPATLNMLAQVPSNPVARGIARFAPGIEPLAEILRTESGVLLMKTDIYAAVLPKTRSLMVVALTQDFVAVRFGGQ